MGNLHGPWLGKRISMDKKILSAVRPMSLARSSAYEVEIVGQGRRGTSEKETDAGRERTLREDSKAVRETEGNERVEDIPVKIGLLIVRRRVASG